MLVHADASTGQRCVATKSDGTPCKAWAIKGGTVCRVHGGSVKRVRAAAERRLAAARAEAVAATYGLPIDIGPHEALLQEIHRTAGHVAWLGLIVADLDQQALVWGVSKETEGVSKETEGDGEDGTHKIERIAAPNIWVKLYQDERRHLVAVCKAAVDAGVSERLVQLEEAKGQMIAQLLQAVFDDDELGLSDEQRRAARMVTARHMRSLPSAS